MQEKETPEKFKGNLNRSCTEIHQIHQIQHQNNRKIQEKETPEKSKGYHNRSCTEIHQIHQIQHEKEIIYDSQWEIVFFNIIFTMKFYHIYLYSQVYSYNIVGIHNIGIQKWIEGITVLCTDYLKNGSINVRST